MTGNSTLHSKPQRKQLADQLDRLDTIIDALADALPAAVADACREGARAAIKDVIVEVLASPDLRALLVPVPREPVSDVPAPAPVEPRRPNFWQRFKALKDEAVQTAHGAVRWVRNVVVEPCLAARETVAAINAAAGEPLPVRRVLLIALGVGLVIGFVCLETPHWLAASVSAGTSASTAIAVQTGNWLKRAVRRFGLMT